MSLTRKSILRILGISLTDITNLSGVTATTAELNYLDLTTLGTGAASKAIVLDASGDYTFPASATIVMPSGGTFSFSSGSTLNAAGTFQVGGVTVSSTAAELNYLDLTTLGTGAASKAIVLDASANYSTPGSGTVTVSSGATLSVAGTLSGTGVGIQTVVRQSADVVKDDGAAAGALTGLVHTVVPGTYAYRANLQTLATANGGIKVTMALTTAVLSSLQNVATAFTATGVAQARSTTATSGATLYGATAAITQIVIEGTMVVSTGGTIQLQGEQNASHADESTFYTGSTFEIVRIA